MNTDSKKSISVLSFFALYVVSIYMNFYGDPTQSNIPAVAYSGVAFALLISFYYMTFLFSDSKRFLVIVSTYFVLLALSVALPFININSNALKVICVIISYTCLLPFIYLDFIDVAANKISPKFDSVFLILGFIITTFYIVYFTSMYINSRRNSK